MITEEDKERIKSEEIFREEIRKTLQEKERVSFRKKSWKFFNSPFGLWLLSTVVVGSVVYFYNDIKLQNEISANNASTIQKLETEASNRLQKFKVALSNQEPSEVYYQKEELAYMIDGILIGDGSFGQKEPVYIFPEYKERTMNSLLYEIERLTTDKKQASTITEAKTILVNIQNSILSIANPPMFHSSIGQRLHQKAQIEPENLTPDENKILAEYREEEKTFNETTLFEYHKEIKMKLDALLSLFQSNTYLKSLSEK